MVIVPKSEQIQILRIKNGLTATGLARKAKLGKYTVARVESGDINPRPNTAKRICDALGVDFEELFTIKK